MFPDGHPVMRVRLIDRLPGQDALFCTEADGVCIVISALTVLKGKLTLAPRTWRRQNVRSISAALNQQIEKLALASPMA